MSLMHPNTKDLTDFEKEKFRVTFDCKVNKDPKETGEPKPAAGKEKLYHQLMKNGGFHSQARLGFLQEGSGGVGVRSDGAEVISSGNADSSVMFSYFWSESDAKAFQKSATSLAKKHGVQVTSQLSEWDSETFKWKTL